jgi:hypothetical protein
MLNAIGSNSLASPGYVGNSLSGLDAQLDKYKVQLADWVNCPSCKTPEGKAKIQELSDKIAAIEQKMKAPQPQKHVFPEARPEELRTGTLGSRLNEYA